MGRRAKIVCTLGPATSGPDQIAALIAAGLDVARLNMSHGTQASHHAAYRNIRAAADASGHSVGVLVDLQEPKIRLGRFASGPVTLAPGAEFTITGEDVPGDETQASTTYAELAGDVRPGAQILVDDGRVVLEVTAVDGAARATWWSLWPAARREPLAAPTRSASTGSAMRSRPDGMTNGVRGESERWFWRLAWFRNNKTAEAGSCPGWDSNPHCTVFETADSAYWSTGA